MAGTRRSEDVYGEKIDRCLYNSLIKFVSGIGVGIVFSAFLFKKKPWPVILGGGIGTGMGISDCNYEFKDTPGGIPLSRKAVGGSFLERFLASGSGGSEESDGSCGDGPKRDTCCDQKAPIKSVLCKTKPPRSPKLAHVKKNFPCKRSNKEKESSECDPCSEE